MRLGAVLEAVWRFFGVRRMDFEMYLHTHLRATCGATVFVKSRKQLILANMVTLVLKIDI